MLVVAAAPSRAQLPAGCGAVVHRVDGVGVYDAGGGPVAFVPDLVGPWWSDRLSRALAPLRCSGPRTGGRMPSRLTLADALGGGEVTASRVADGWRARLSPEPGAAGEADAGGGGRVGTRRAVRDRPVPRRPARARRRDDGFGQVGVPPHAGHFARDLVARPRSSPSSSSTSRAGPPSVRAPAFPTSSAWSPTSTTTWSPRALASLRAELRRRERLLAAVGANDLEAYQRVRRPDVRAAFRGSSSSSTSCGPWSTSYPTS